MKTLILVSACVIFTGCAKIEQLHIQNMPEELKDCKVFFAEGIDAKVIRCPNSSTSTNVVTVIDEG